MPLPQLPKEEGQGAHAMVHRLCFLDFYILEILHCKTINIKKVGGVIQVNGIKIHKKEGSLVGQGQASEGN